ncbi:MAG: ribonuclease HII [Gammaproteobacteria bacterium]
MTTISPLLIAGIDEAGRGPLAGPVVAAAVILDPAKPIVGINDSKKLSEKKRQELFYIIQQQALAFAIAQASVAEIDELNILQASLLAMYRAAEQLTVQPTKILIDGNQIPPQITIPAEAIIKGDALEPAIGAASILAKVARDNLMLAYEDEYPQYGFAKHKGYPTAYHLAQIRQFGVTNIHRRSFAPVRACLNVAISDT